MANFNETCSRTMCEETIQQNTCTKTLLNGDINTRIFDKCSFNRNGGNN